MSKEVGAMSYVDVYDYFSFNLPEGYVLDDHVIENASGSKCKICNEVFIFTEREVIQTHVYMHLGIIPYLCKICGKKFSDRSGVRLHVRQMHLERHFKCNVCSSVYVSQHKLDTHTKVHDKTTLYTCDLCGRSLCNKQAISNHIKNVHVERTFLCQQCGRTFKTNMGLNKHLKYYHDKANIKKFECIICDKTFVDGSSYNDHNRRHTNDLLTCDICKKTFNSKPCLSSHIMGQHFPITKRQYKCTMCGNKYKSNLMCKDHERKHQGIRKYSCKICFKAFTQQSHVDTHMHVHSEHRFECSLCGGKFNRNDNLKSHVKRHETSARLKKLASAWQKKKA